MASLYFPFEINFAPFSIYGAGWFAIIAVDIAMQNRNVRIRFIVMCF